MEARAQKQQTYLVIVEAGVEAGGGRDVLEVTVVRLLAEPQQPRHGVGLRGSVADPDDGHGGAIYRFGTPRPCSRLNVVNRNSVPYGN